jgi:hypothetical protein
VHRRLQGEVGTKVRLLVVRGDRVEELVIERAPYRR